MDRRRWRNLVVAGSAPAAILFAAFDLYQWVVAYESDNFHNDFTFYYAGARVGLAHGWQSLYDLHLQQLELNAMGAGITIAELARYISPPPVAWIAVPFTLLPYQPAYLAWSLLLLLALGWTWRLAAPGRGPARLIHLAAAVGWLPVIYGLQLGQPGLFVAAGVAGAYALMRRDQHLLAGVALGAMVLKPQLAFLVPAALLVGGRYRAFWGAALAIGLLGVASAVVIGPDGVGSYLQRLNFAAGVPVNRAMTLAPVVGSVTAARIVEAAIAAWSLVLAYRLRRRGVEWVLVPALVGGLLASPYLHADDLVMLGLAAWLYLRTGEARPWSGAYLLLLVVAAEGIPIWGAVPVIAGELGALVLMSLVKPEERRGVSAGGPQGDELVRETLPA